MGAPGFDPCGFSSESSLSNNFQIREASIFPWVFHASSDEIFILHPSLGDPMYLEAHHPQIHISTADHSVWLWNSNGFNGSSELPHGWLPERRLFNISLCPFNSSPWDVHHLLFFQGVPCWEMITQPMAHSETWKLPLIPLSLLSHTLDTPSDFVDFTSNYVSVKT